MMARWWGWRAIRSPPRSTRRAASLGVVVVVGAGPAGLTAAYQLARRGATCTVFEMDTVVGGHLAHGGAGGVAVRHRGAPFLHQGA